MGSHPLLSSATNVACLISATCLLQALVYAEDSSPTENQRLSPVFLSLSALLVSFKQTANQNVLKLIYKRLHFGLMSAAGSTAPGGASEAALSQTPAGGFANFFEGLKSSFGQSSQNTEATTSDGALVEAASKAANEAADKALESVGSQVADSSATAERGSDPEQVPTGLGAAGGDPSSPQSLTASMEAETDQNSDKPAVQALASGTCR